MVIEPTVAVFAIRRYPSVITKLLLLIHLFFAPEIINQTEYRKATLSYN